MDLPNIKPDDKEKIDGAVAQFRRTLEHIYQIEYIQGAIDEAKETTEKMRRLA